MGTIGITPDMFRMPEFYVKVLTILVIIYIVWYLIFLSKRLGGMFGRAIRPFAIGIIILSVESIDKVLEYFHLDFVQKVLTEAGENCFHAILQFAGLAFIAYGTYKINKLVQRSKLAHPKN